MCSSLFPRRQIGASEAAASVRAAAQTGRPGCGRGPNLTNASTPEVVVSLKTFFSFMMSDAMCLQDSDSCLISRFLLPLQEEMKLQLAEVREKLRRSRSQAKKKQSEARAEAEHRAAMEEEEEAERAERFRRCPESSEKRARPRYAFNFCSRPPGIFLHLFRGPRGAGLV